MREIKFRGWCETDNGNEMVYFGKCELDNGLWFNSDIHTSEHYSIMQFTGLTDKNGKDIYEGDVCRINFYDEGLKNGVVVFRVFHSGYYLEGDFGQYSMGSWEPNYIEVIGNIHENPDLL